MALNTTTTNYTEEYLKAKSIYDLRRILRSLGGVPGGKGKAELISDVLSIQQNILVPKRSARGRKPLEMKEYADNFEKNVLNGSGEGQTAEPSEPFRDKTEISENQISIFVSLSFSTGKSLLSSASILNNRNLPSTYAGGCII